MERHWWGNTLQSFNIHCWDSLQRQSEAKSPFFKRGAKKRRDLKSRLLEFLFMHISLMLPWWISIHGGTKAQMMQSSHVIEYLGWICIITWNPRTGKSPIKAYFWITLFLMFYCMFWSNSVYMNAAPWKRFSLWPLFHVHHSTPWFMETIRSAAGKNLQTSAWAIVYCSQDVVETLSPGPKDPELRSLRLRASVFKSTVSGKDGKKQFQSLKP